MMDAIRKRLDELVAECEELEEKLADPEITGTNEYVELSQRYAKLKRLTQDYEQLRGIEAEIADTEAWLQEDPDEEMRELIEEDLETNRQKRDRLMEGLKEAILPDDPSESKNAIIEIRGGAGGEESALFASDLFRMYSRYAETKGFRIELMESHPTELGGFKTVVFSVNGRDAYRLFKFESGVHRVQRVPETETAGRIHTSTATVAVLPEVESVDVEIYDKDLEMEAFRASGPGGQSVNKVNSAIRITHQPTGISVACQEERSQHKNRERAMRLLRAKIKQQQEEEMRQERDHKRRIQVGSGERSEKIRTYNFPQNRVTDHRIQLTIHQLDRVLEGQLDLLIEPLQEAHREDMLAELVEA